MDQKVQKTKSTKAPFEGFYECCFVNAIFANISWHSTKFTSESEVRTLYCGGILEVEGHELQHSPRNRAARMMWQNSRKKVFYHPI